MKLTITDLLYKELIWNKEKVVINYMGETSEMKRLEFQYEAIDNNYEVISIEPQHFKETNTCYLLINCEQKRYSDEY